MNDGGDSEEFLSGPFTGYIVVDNVSEFLASSLRCGDRFVVLGLPGSSYDGRENLEYASRFRKKVSDSCRIMTEMNESSRKNILDGAMQVFWSWNSTRKILIKSAKQRNQA